MRRRSNRLRGVGGVVEDLGLEFRFEQDDDGNWLNAYLPSGDRIGKIMYGACRGEAWNAGKWRSAILDVAVEPEYRGMGVYPAMLSALRDKVRQDKRCAGLFSDGDSREPIATASWEKFAEREPRVSRRGGNYYLDGLKGLAANGERGLGALKLKRAAPGYYTYRDARGETWQIVSGEENPAYGTGTIWRVEDPNGTSHDVYYRKSDAVLGLEAMLRQEGRLMGLAANGQRGGSALPLAAIALVGLAGFAIWKLLSSGETETEAREAVGTGPCRDIDSQLAAPIGCGTAAVTGYVGGKGSPITIREIPGAPGYYLQSSPVDVWSAFQRLKTAAVNAGNAVTVNSAFRTMAKQSALYADYMAGRGNKAARPGYSKHQNGTAIDLAVKQGNLLSWLRSNASAYGFSETVLGENWHWEYDPARDRYARIA